MRSSVGAFGFILVLSVVGCVAAVPGVSRSEEAPAAGGGAQSRDPLAFRPVKLGLDALLRIDGSRNQSLADFSFSPGNDDGRILARLRPSVTYAPTEYLTARVEGQWYAYADDTDFSRFLLYQGYAEGSWPGSGKVSLKAGRQEFVYGSTFILGADGFFDGLSFDAVKIGLKPIDGLSVDIFGGGYVDGTSGDIAGKLYGVYGTWSRGEDLAVDLYGFRDTGGAGLTHPGGEHERTWSLGARLLATIAKGVAVEVEPVYQFGRKDRGGQSHAHIGAYGGHVDLTIDPPLGRYPGKLFLSYAFGSGDRNGTEGKFREFHNPNHDSSLMGDMSVVGDLSGVAAGDIAASGLHVFTAGGGVDLSEKLNLSIDGHWFRAVKVPAGISRSVGTEANLILTYKLRETVSLLASVNRFFTGGFFRDAAGSGRDIDYGYLMFQATF
jgi:hypothetical protein